MIESGRVNIDTSQIQLENNYVNRSGGNELEDSSSLYNAKLNKSQNKKRDVFGDSIVKAKDGEGLT